MNYEIIYSNLITSRLNKEIDPDEYYEKNHIWPKSLDGGNNKDNIIHLTAREHFIAHKLLTKITEGEDRKKMFYALWYITNVNGKYIKSREYEKIRKEISKNISNFMKNRVISDETREKQSRSRKGRITSEETKLKLRESGKNRKRPDTSLKNIQT